MSRWTHRICVDCWIVHFGQDEPHKLTAVATPEVEDCCFCGDTIHVMTGGAYGGIYVRHDPAELRCKGVHDA